MERWPYLLWGDERRDVRGDRRRVHFSMTAGCCRSLSTAASTECRAINAMAFLPRERRKRRGGDRRCLASHARAFSAHARTIYRWSHGFQTTSRSLRDSSSGSGWRTRDRCPRIPFATVNGEAWTARNRHEQRVNSENSIERSNSHRSEEARGEEDT